MPYPRIFGETNSQGDVGQSRQRHLPLHRRARQERLQDLDPDRHDRSARHTVLNIDVRSAQSRVTLVEGQAIVCPRKAGITFDQQVCNRTKPTGGFGGPHCDCVNLANAGHEVVELVSDSVPPEVKPSPGRPGPLSAPSATSFVTAALAERPPSAAGLSPPAGGRHPRWRWSTP
jgi:hypothetical protein